MNNTIYFETFSVIKDQTLYNENLIYKGDLGVELDLTKISESSSKALKLTIDWGDGSDRETYERQLLYQYIDSSILDEVNSGKVGGSVLNKFDHVYEPAETHVSKLSAQILVNYDNGGYLRIVQPITFVRESYHDTIKELNLTEVGIHDGTMTTIASIQSENNKRSYIASLKSDNAIPIQTICDSPGILKLTKYEKSVPAGGLYSVGDAITYELIIQNIGGNDIITNPVEDTLEDITVTLNPQLLDGGITIQPREVVKMEYTYIVTLEDTERGSIENTANSGEFISNTVTITKLKPPAKPGILVLNKTEDSSGPYISGINDKITFVVEATNVGESDILLGKLTDSIGEPGVDFTVIEDNGGLFNSSITTIAVGAVFTAKYEYSISAEEFVVGELTNNVTDLASGTSASVTVKDLDANSFTFVVDTNKYEQRDFTTGSGQTFAQTSTDSDEFLFPTLGPDTPCGDGEYNCIVEWGDGTFDKITTWNDPKWRHKYSELGLYTIKVTGTFKGWSFLPDGLGTGPYDKDGGGTADYAEYGVNFEREKGGDYRLNDRVKYIDTIKYGSLVLTSKERSSYAWNGCVNYTGDYSLQNIIGQPTIDGSNFSATFRNCPKFNGYVDAWDMSNVTNIARMFDGCVSFNRNINGWDVSNVTAMGGLFNSCVSFNQPLDNWGPQVTNLEGSMAQFMNGCSNFTYSLENWGPSLGAGVITNMGLAFNGCNKFNQPLNTWGPALSNCTDFNTCFKSCTVFNQPLDNWDTGEARRLDSMFNNCSFFNQNIDNWNVGKVTTLQATFAGCFKFNQPLTSWGPQLGNVRTLNKTFASCGQFNQSINSWGPYMNKVTDMQYTFSKCSNYNQPMNTWNISQVRNMFATFQKCSKFNQDLNDWADNLDPGQDFFNITQMYITWNRCSSFGSSPGDISFSKWANKLPKAGRVELTFAGCPLRGDCGFGLWDPTSFNSIKSIFSSTNINDSPGIDSWGPKLNNISGAVSGDGFTGTFASSTFNQPLPSWSTAVKNARRLDSMFWFSNFDQDISSWDFSSIQGTVLNAAGTGPVRDSRGRLLQPSLENFLGKGTINSLTSGTPGSYSQVNYDILINAFKVKHEAGEMNDRIWLTVWQARSAASNTAYNYLVDTADWDIVDATVISGGKLTRNSGPV